MSIQLTPGSSVQLQNEVLAEADRRKRVLDASSIPDRHILDEFGSWVPFHEGQEAAWDSDARFTFVLAGSQGGKTTFGPLWLWREIQRCGRGDYLAATATYDLFKLKMLPAMRGLFERQLGVARYWAGAKVLELCEPTSLRFLATNQNDPMWGRIILRSAQSEGGLESATANAAWLDECGMDEFGLGSWEAVQRRLSIRLGRVLGTTTLYNLGWLKTEVHARWRAKDPLYNVVQFASIINPAFPKEEFDRVVETMPQWKVNMFYRGLFDIPEGLIYNNFDLEQHTIADFPVPDSWPCYAGVDFGGVHMAAVRFREDPASGNLYLTEEYLEGRKTIAQHADTLKQWGVKFAVGGAGSEDQWRDEFGAAGFPIREPLIGEVEVGIDRVYAQHAKGAIIVFKSCRRYLDEKGTYSREIDKGGQPTEKIANKSTFHLMDAERYIVSTIRARTGNVKVRRMSDA